MHEIAMDGGLLVAVVQIIAIDILLGGDNAVVIALACRKLPEHQRSRGIFWGVFGAVALRIVLIAFALQLLALPWLKLVGAALLVWIGVKLLLPEEGEGHGEIAASASLAGAVKTIIVADAVMSVDNVIAVAAAAKDSLALVAFGIAISVPIIVWGSKLVLKLMDRFPWVITVGGGLLGWIAGQMAIGDVVLAERLAGAGPWPTRLAPVAGAALVVALGTLLAQRVRRKVAAVELASGASETER